jgi:hypothetical protein
MAVSLWQSAKKLPPSVDRPTPTFVQVRHTARAAARGPVLEALVNRSLPFAVLAPAAALLLAACGGLASDSANQDDATATVYMNVEDFLQQPGQTGIDQYFGLRAQLSSEFDDLCGDTFCESDYDNLHALSFRCSVTSKTGKIKSCTYVFAGSYEEVDARTGAIIVNARTFNCPVVVTSTIKQLFAVLLAPPANITDTALRRQLPGETHSIYDSLGGCLP